MRDKGDFGGGIQPIAAVLIGTNEDTPKSENEHSHHAIVRQQEHAKWSEDIVNELRKKG